MPFIDLDTGISMHYREGGDGSPIVFVPGFSATADSFNYQMLDLTDRFRCICIDQRGHGLTDKPVSAYTYDEFCEDLVALVTALDLRDVTLVGWSMGAGVALKYATEFNADARVSRLAMVGAATPRFQQTDAEPFGMDAETAAATLEGIRRSFPEAMAGFAGANFHRTDLEATTAWFLSQWLMMPAYAAYWSFRSLLEEDLRENVAKVAMPTLLMQGRHDQVCDVRWIEYMEARIPDAKSVFLENSGHALMVEEPDRFSEEIATFARQPISVA
jgi:pimeloyl-ACP methyl ester carboxylesterase